MKNKFRIGNRIASEKKFKKYFLKEDTSPTLKTMVQELSRMKKEHERLEAKMTMKINLYANNRIFPDSENSDSNSSEHSEYEGDHLVFDKRTPKKKRRILNRKEEIFQADYFLRNKKQVL